MLCKLDDSLADYDKDQVNDEFFYPLLNELRRTENSRKKYTSIVVGHHPLFTDMTTFRKSSSCLSGLITHLLAHYGVSMYMSGHDHTSQYYLLADRKEAREKKQRKLHTFISGAGAGYSDEPSKSLKYSFSNSTYFYYSNPSNSSIGGFLAFDFHENNFNFTFINSNGEIPYQQTLINYNMN